MRYWFVIVLLLFGISTAAQADRDPLCRDSSLRDQPIVIDATQDSTIYFCSPSHGATGVPYPDPPGGPPMTCSLIVAGKVVATVENVGPEQLIPYTDTTLRFDHAADIICSNSEGEGRLLSAVSAIFRPDAPGRPSILPGS